MLAQYSSLIALCLFMFWVPGAFAQSELASMRVGQSEDKTRIVFDLNQLQKYEVGLRSNPSRVVVEFYGTKNELSFDDKHLSDSRLFKIKVDETKKRTRVVMALHKHVDFTSFTLGKNKNGHERLVVDLRDPKPDNVTTVSSSAKSVKPVENPKVADKQPVKKAIAAVKAKSESKPAEQVVKKPVVKVVKLAEKPSSPPPSAKVAKLTETNKLEKNEKTKSLLKQDSEVFSESRGLVVAIDAGHGGKDVGAIGPNNLFEKEATLQMAIELKRLIDKQPGMHAILTRKKDVFIPLKERVEIAKRHEADIFISIHADAFHDKSVRGGSVYILSESGASSVMAKLIAHSENASLQDVKLQGREDDVAFALSDLTREANIRTSRKLGKVVLKEMQKKVKMHKHSVQSAGFAVLRSIDMPSLLIETAFISNPYEEKRLMNKKFQTKMASAIVNGLTKFVDQNAKKPRWGERLYVYYRVQRGDTLSEIAHNYQVSVKELKKINKIRDANELYIGKRMKIPLSEKVIASL